MNLVSAWALWAAASAGSYRGGVGEPCWGRSFRRSSPAPTFAALALTLALALAITLTLAIGPIGGTRARRLAVSAGGAGALLCLVASVSGQRIPPAAGAAAAAAARLRQPTQPLGSQICEIVQKSCGTSP